MFLILSVPFGSIVVYGLYIKLELKRIKKIPGRNQNYLTLMGYYKVRKLTMKIAHIRRRYLIKIRFGCILCAYSRAVALVLSYRSISSLYALYGVYPILMLC